MDSGSGPGSCSGSDSGRGAGEGDFCFTSDLDGPACGLDFFEVEARVLDLDEAASVADISTISESLSDTTTGFLPPRAGCFLGFSGGTATLKGSGLGGMDILVDLRVGTGTSSTSSSSPSSTATEALAVLVLVETLELAMDRPLRRGRSRCMVSLLTAVGFSLTTPRLRLTGGGESSTGCTSSSDSGTALSAVFDRTEVRVREVVDGGFFAREDGFSMISSLTSSSTSDRPRFLREARAFSSGGTEVDVDRVARRGGMSESEGQR